MYLLLQLMRVTILQTDIIWGSPEENMEKAAKRIKEANGADLYVLPEMWSTGFATEPEGIADETGTALNWMRNTAAEVQAAICGSVSVKDGNHYVNRFYFVKPDKEYECYDKHHLFTYGHEDRFYQAGKRRTVVEYKGVRFLLVTCYDLRFPLWLRYRDDYDAIIVVANWPENRQHAWEILTHARAIENQAYVIACNRIGKDQQCHYAGGSALIDPYGKTVAEARHHAEETIGGNIDMGLLSHFREKFPVLKEKDDYEIKTK